MSEAIKNLKSTVVISPEDAANFRLIADRRGSVEHTLQLAINAAVQSAQELSRALDDEQRALFEKILQEHGRDIRLTWSVDASNPAADAYLFDHAELEKFNAGEVPPDHGPLAVSQDVIDAIKKDLEAEVGGAVSLEQLQKRLDETFGEQIVVLTGEGTQAHAAAEKKVEQVFSPD